MRPLDDPKPEIYFKIFLKIIICLNIISGIMRVLASIFLFVFLHIKLKNQKCKFFIFLYLVLKQYNLVNPLIANNDTRFSDSNLSYYTHNNSGKFYNNFNSVIESEFVPISNLKSTLIRNNNNFKSMRPPDVNIYLLNEKKIKNDVNNVYINVYNFNHRSDKPNVIERKKRANTFDSSDIIDDYIDNIYDSPNHSES